MASSTAVCNDGSFSPPVISANCRGGFDFTVFFEEVILCMLPAALYLMGGSLESAFMLGKPRCLVMKSPLRFVKLIFIFIFAALQVSLVALWALEPFPSTTMPLVSAILALVVAAVFAVNSTIAHRASPRPSLIISAYLFISVLADIPRVRTLWLMGTYTNVAAILSSSLAIKLILLWLENIGKRPLLLEKYANISAEETAGLFSRGLFFWLTRLMITGSRQVLNMHTLLSIHQRINSSATFPQLKKALENTDMSHKYGLVFATFKAWPLEAAKIIFPRLVVLACSLVQPFLVQAVVDNVLAPDTQPIRNSGYGLIGAVTTGIYEQLTFRYIALIRGGLITNIFDKLNNISTKAATDSGSPIMTLIGTDVERICETWSFLIAELWPAVLQLGVGVWLLERQLGAVCIAPVILAFASTLICAKASSLVGSRQGIWLKAVQRRVNFTSHALGNIKSIKLLGYTTSIHNMIQSQRAEELELSKKFRRLSSFNICLVNVPNIISQLITFAAYAIVSRVQGHDDFNTTKAITSLALLAIIMQPLGQLLYTVPQAFAAIGCFERIQAFLNEKETQDDRVIGQTSVTTENSASDIALLETQPVPDAETAPVISVQNATIGWESPVVHNVSFSSSMDSRFIALVGPVASGKSTIISALLGEAQIFSGTVQLATNDLAFCQQTPWLPSGTIRDQIIGDDCFSKEWYDEVVGACALDYDIATLQDGDQSEAGVQGVSLSGGQRQRLAIARALYARKPIAIFDDVLSALDSSTQDIIADKVFGRDGLLRRMKATVVFATHSMRHLHAADIVVALTSDGQHTTHVVDHSRADPSVQVAIQDDQIVEAAPHSDVTANAIVAEKDFRQEADNLAKAGRSIGDLEVYKYYFASLGWSSLCIFLAFVLTEAGFSALQLVWVKLWSSSNDRTNAKYWLSLYALWAVIRAASLIAAVYYLYVGIVPKSGKRLHLSVLNAALKAPMSFHSKTDIGTLVNRFSQDMQLIDMILPGALITTAFHAASCISVSALTIAATPYFAAVLPFLLLALGTVHRFYLRTSKQLRLLELESKAPLYSHIIDTINGIVSIRAFGWFAPYKAQYFQLMDECQKPFYLLLCIQRWLSVVLGLTVTCMVTILTALAVTVRGSTVSAGFTGIALVNMMSLSQSLASLIIFWTSLETSLGAVSRVKSFSEDTPVEESPDAPVAHDWPKSGHVQFDGVTAAHVDFVALRNVSIEIASGERIAVCGRTGSGKSSFISSVLGMMDIRSGSIKLDGQDLAQIDREIVRSRVTYITQDPFLFTGSLRQNLCLGGDSTDAELEECMKAVGLWEQAQESSGEGCTETVLDMDMERMQLSQGQQQLLCLARASLRKSKLVLLDEPTASVDTITEAKMAEVIARKFEDATVIMVTHRLSSIHSFDKVIVLNAGEVVEYGPPAELLADTTSALHQLYRVQS
ncbi:ABC transmembrane type 1 [Cordyceps militaris]|uniref:ABC transmembrane type 1 n=1 Tax=Cordyceps militaris TaxID=73501 RepID=A0A2H4S765_CORMI|nr:ABC transmembrane type 1 [Cordyceps militaris]